MRRYSLPHLFDKIIIKPFSSNLSDNIKHTKDNCNKKDIQSNNCFDNIHFDIYVDNDNKFIITKRKQISVQLYQT